MSCPLHFFSFLFFSLTLPLPPLSLTSSNSQSSHLSLREKSYTPVLTALSVCLPLSCFSERGLPFHPKPPRLCSLHLLFLLPPPLATSKSTRNFKTQPLWDGHRCPAPVSGTSRPTYTPLRDVAFLFQSRCL